MAKERKDVAEHLKWKTTDIFATEQEWEKLFKECEKRINFKKYEGKLGNADTLFECFEELGRLSKDLNRLGIYSFMKYDEDTRSSKYLAMNSRIEDLDMKVSQSIAFITPELTALPTETLEEFAANPKLRDYDYTIRCIIKQKPHVLPKEIEGMLASAGKVFGGYHQVFNMIDNADFPFPTVTVDGKRVKLSHGLYGVLLRHPDGNVRKKVFKSYYKAYMGLANTITATYSGNVDKNVFLARTRKYKSCLASALHNEDVDVAVYENLLASVNKGLPTLHRYFADRKEILGLEKQHMWDLYTSLVEDAEIKVDYEEAFKIVKEGLKPLGEEYGRLLQEAHDNGWIDVEETVGKRSGAYSTSVYGLSHPYVLLNYQPTTNDVFTIAHELGHAMHSYFSERNQPQEKADYKIFVAEVASTVNEVLLIKHLLATTTDNKLKKYLLSYYIDTLKSTLFRQTQFAEFEYVAHSLAEKGQPLTKERLCKEYLKLNKKYYGKAVVSDKEISYEWSRIPHFYRAFYVYKYATGIISAVSIAERILSEGEPAVKDYFKFLSSGGSDSPVELLKLAGVDLTSMKPFDSCMESFANALEEFETL